MGKIQTHCEVPKAMVKHFRFIRKTKGFFDTICFQFRLELVVAPCSFLYALLKNPQNILQVIFGLLLIVYLSQTKFELLSLALAITGLFLVIYRLYVQVRLNGELLDPDHEYNTIKEEIINKIKPGVDSNIVKLSKGSAYHNQKFNDWLMNNADWTLDQALIKTSPHAKTKKRQAIMKQIGGLRISAIGLLMQSVLSGKDFFNASLLGLQSDPFDGFSPEYTPALEPTTYFEFYLTNRLCSQIYRPIKQEDKDVNFADMYPASENKLLPIGSKANNTANVIGVSTVVITKDQRLLSWFQGKRNQSSVGLITPTGSGSCDWSDLKKNNDIQLNGKVGFKDILKKGMLRELREETKCCSTADKSCKQLHGKIDVAAENFKRTIILGAYRWLEHGATPDFVGITRLDIEGVNRQLCPDDHEVIFSFKTKKKLKEPLDIQIGHMRSVADIPRVITAIEEHLKEYGNQLSVPMEYVYKQILHYLKESQLLLSNDQGLPQHLHAFLLILDPGFSLK